MQPIPPGDPKHTQDLRALVPSCAGGEAAAAPSVRPILRRIIYSMAKRTKIRAIRR